ncbi:putative bifunctional diguanylate cyclase/phosphodiesterase [Aureimonas phyllosphaerae]|uniref:EAL domain-containing protein (Putative c-di-GMP-specific phosphodiesterase class I) n=1 Tax=Aureimonas phyllosphaerae TaxID=1166078 RepID=A0A7W6FSP4_9HYPH|nr:EAL domain-containing protein [Aureimonas phyllosphaerae]MBB3934188.1 EAL domain-containing protein (putative c-di-GMP-specific phosphodiesterase class I) [Aureimonas phyllosphaerae]MBB3958596.1 EAL domain-containing protein (putative c-di-GMP-specific phosphodiesterase class I) [Aureimonas phyllosphaerae]SFE99406.1 EAL domain, c-di-GMP-specific phosphodiesterase class I (or its enzymatically inactive variant) [Aureimonas phyllosphaerae]
MYAAKADGKGKVKVFYPAMLEERRTRRILEMDLRHAVQDGCLELNFQPLFDAQTARLKSFEALVRWHHPMQGTIAPDQFIPLAEETGLIVALGDWVLREACAEAAQWPADIGIAVNVSALQVGHGEMLPVLVNTLAATGLDPSRLELEITESSLLALKPETVGFLRSVQELGVRVSIDDFGTGYSSMSSLQNFRFDKIKIDRSFVQAINGDAKSVAIIKSILELSSKIGVTTTAEGVETSAQLDYITANGCTEAQGFLFAKPMSKEAAREFIRQNA